MSWRPFVLLCALLIPISGADLGQPSADAGEERHAAHGGIQQVAFARGMSVARSAMQAPAPAPRRDAARPRPSGPAAGERIDHANSPLSLHVLLIT